MYWPHPGVPRGDGQSAEPEVMTEDGEISLEASHFVLLIVVPDDVDELHLGGGQNRVMYRRANADPASLESLRGAVWSETSVNP